MARRVRHISRRTGRPNQQQIPQQPISLASTATHACLDICLPFPLDCLHIATQHARLANRPSGCTSTEGVPTVHALLGRGPETAGNRRPQSTRIWHPSTVRIANRGHTYHCRTGVAPQRVPIVATHTHTHTHTCCMGATFCKSCTGATAKEKSVDCGDTSPAVSGPPAEVVGAVGGGGGACKGGRVGNAPVMWTGRFGSGISRRISPESQINAHPAGVRAGRVPNGWSCFGRADCTTAPPHRPTPRS